MFEKCLPEKILLTRFYELFVGLRYLKAKKSHKFISFNTILSTIIVFIGVFILIVVISVMNGFQSQIKDKILDVDSHISIMPYYTFGDPGIKNYREVVSKISKLDGVKLVTPYVQGQGLLRYQTFINPVIIRGVGEKNELPVDVAKFIVKGEKKFSNNKEVYIGQEMADEYNIKLNNYIEIIVPRGTLSLTEGVTPGIGRFKVIGFIKTGYLDFDTRLILMSLTKAQNLFEVGDTAWGIGIKINDIYKMQETAEAIPDLIGYKYDIKTAEERNQNLFYALRLEKLIMTIILFLVIFSASFTIMGTLVMVVMEKRKDIGILKAMGARPNSILTIFVLEGFFIGVLGSLLGVIFGLAAAVNLQNIIRWIEMVINSFLREVYQLLHLGIFSEVVLIPKNVYYIDVLPTEIDPVFVVIIAVISVIIATAAAVFPSWHAARLKPVETIRYE